MNIYDAAEYAYKNGYEAGATDFAKKLKEKLGVEKNYAIDETLKEMVGDSSDR